MTLQSVTQTLRYTRRSLAVSFAAILLAGSLLPATAIAQDAPENSWEFRVCADPLSLPYSNRAEEGFENALAELLADEMGATLTYDWGTYNADTIDLRLRGGECDAIMGVPDEQEGLLKTVAYYRSPFVFATLASAGLEIESLDDPQLRDLRIGVQNFSIPPQEGLLNRGIVNVHGPSGTRPNPYDRVLRELVAGEIDVGILWGPNAAYLARNLDAEFVIEPVTPEIDAPFIPMSLPMTIGVRVRDYSLRDRLDLAIAARWDDIHALLEDYGVPLSQMARPMASVATGAGASSAVAEPDEPIAVGVLLPMTTGNRTNPTSLYDLIGDDAYRGIELATSDLNAAAGRDRYRLQVSSTPSEAAAERAADRLLAVEGVDVLIGGLGADQAITLAQRAAKHGRLYLDIGTTESSGPLRCLNNTFFVEASARSYIDALLTAHGERGVRSWFVVHEISDSVEVAGAAAGAAAGSKDASLRNSSGSTLQAVAEAAIRADEGASLVGASAVRPGQPVYRQTVDAIRASAPDGVLVLLSATDQLAFLGQTIDLGVEAVLAPFPLPVTQTRDFLGATLNRVAYEEDPLRVVSFEPNRPAEEDSVQARFAGRYATPMEASAYTGYQALLLLDAAARDSDDPGAWAAYLARPGATFDGPKGVVSFDSERHLRQPLDVIALDIEAEWHNSLAGMLGVAKFVASVVPSSEVASGMVPVASCEGL